MLVVARPRANRTEELRSALVREVSRLAEGLAHEPLPQAANVALTRDKGEPLVRGLFRTGRAGRRAGDVPEVRRLADEELAR